jgi:general secretion pathway protein D
MKRIGLFAASRTRAVMQTVAWAAACVIAASLASAQQAQQKITPNFKDADITMIAEAVSAATGKNFLLEPRVRAQVTLYSSTPMTPEAFYQAFLSILQVYGFVAMPAGDVIKILPDAQARTMPGNDLPNRVSSTSDEIVTQVIQVKNVNAAQLVPILRSLIPQNGHLAAYQPSNILIISDRAANVNRIMRIIERVDQAGNADVEVVPLQNASATDIVRVITTLYQQQQAAEGGANPMKLVADERSNSVLVSGDPSQRLRIKTLIAHLDTPLESGGDTRVRYLQYADAEKIATKLKEQITGVAAAAPAGGAGGAAGAAAQAEKGTTIWADPETNSLIITAQPKTMKSLMNIIDRLDIRRMQVLVEAIIVEVNTDKNSELGVNWAAWSTDDKTRIPLGGFINPVGGASLIDLASLANNPTSSSVNPNVLSGGTTLGIGRIADTGINFAAMLRAIRNDTNTNIIATPSAVTMDNQEAQVKVAQEVPFVTGQFTNTGAAGGSVNPFQTIQRQEVGTILKLTPQIAQGGNSVALKIEIESSSIGSSAVTTVDVVTNKRTISTNVLIEDGGIVVLGGLISDFGNKKESRVPFLGRIPLIGLAFKTRASQHTKTNLMIFIRPKILRDGTQTAIATDEKYNYMRTEQKSFNQREVLPLLPNKESPRLQPAPPLPDPKTVRPAMSPEEQAQENARKREEEDAARKAQPKPSQEARPQPAPAPQATPAPAPSPETPRGDAPRGETPTPPPG